MEKPSYLSEGDWREWPAHNRKASGDGNRRAGGDGPAQPRCAGARHRASARRVKTRREPSEDTMQRFLKPCIIAVLVSSLAATAAFAQDQWYY
jgi:hypothetical protein